MELTTLLFSALASEYGIAVTTSDAELLRQKLYKVRRADPTSFDTLHFVIQREGELWIVKKTEPSHAQV